MTRNSLDQKIDRKNGHDRKIVSPGGQTGKTGLTEPEKSYYTDPMSAHDDMMPWDVTDAEAFDLDIPSAQAEDEQSHWEEDPEYLALYFSPVEQGYYDDDPNPYHGDYSEM